MEKKDQHQPATEKKRIEYIDLMKGVCITLVVLYHVIDCTNIQFIDNALANFRMPLYFFLSGLFFKKWHCLSCQKILPVFYSPEGFVPLSFKIGE